MIPRIETVLEYAYPDERGSRRFQSHWAAKKKKIVVILELTLGMLRTKLR
jgi:hypothetical protein